MGIEPSSGRERNVLVTAGAAGIGRAIVAAFTKLGYRVAVADIDSTALDELKGSEPGVFAGTCDVASAEEVDEFMRLAMDHLDGRLDVVISNAGVAGPTVPLERLDPSDWDRVLSVNLSGAFNLCRRAIPYLRRSDAGALILVSSVAGRFGYPRRAAYAASKWGLIGLTKSLSMELGRDGITVNSILPGGVDGKRLRDVIAARAEASGKSVAEERSDVLAGQSLEKLVKPEEVAALATFLASDQARSISGQALSIDNDAWRA